ncbi:MAG: L-aminopeptidase/D-esterase [Steroidobacteraceae bacterium]|nr:L-aminopeptidase/D-esterase [Steroidobacteraceae bacterium]
MKIGPGITHCVAMATFGAVFAAGTASAAERTRARDLGIPFAGRTGPLNAITDVAGVEVGYTTLVEGDGALQVGKGPVRTGVTAILPRGRKGVSGVFGAYAVGNGNGEMTGTIWIEESGIVGTPICITNTHSVGVVRDAVIDWMIRNGGTEQLWGLPVVAETWDGYLNDLNGFHVKPQHVFGALDGARGGPIAEGNVGGGTGMHTFEFKGGTGTSSRLVRIKDVGDYTVGVLVQSNFGRRWQLQVAGVPVGREWPEDAPFTQQAGVANELGSIIVVVATDAPLLPTQLKRIAHRSAMGIARTGGTAGNGSGDIFLAFSTANAAAASADRGLQQVSFVPNDQLDGMFEATVLAVEEAIVNAMVAAHTMTGIDGNTLAAIDHARLQQILARYNRLEKR